MSTRGPGWAISAASARPIEVRRLGNLTYVQWSRLPVALVSDPGDWPGEVDDRVGEMDDRVGEVVEPGPPVGATPTDPVVDPMAARIAELVSAARTEGRPVGRRTVARELGITEYAAGRLLAHTNTNGRH